MDDFDTDSQCAYPDCDSGNKADSRCGRCRKAYYCSRRCQRKHWKDHKPVCEPVDEPQAGADSSADIQDLKEAHTKLQVEKEELEREYEKLKRHKRDRSLIYQAEISKLQEALIQTEKQKKDAEKAEEEAEANPNLGEKERKHRRNRSMYYQEQIQILTERVKDVEQERNDVQLKVEDMKNDPSAVPDLEKSGHTEDGYLDPKSNKFPYAELQGGNPDGINNRKKELYLSPEDFHEVFGVSVDEYDNLKEWKKQKMKRDKDLF